MRLHTGFAAMKAMSTRNDDPKRAWITVFSRKNIVVVIADRNWTGRT